MQGRSKYGTKKPKS